MEIRLNITIITASVFCYLLVAEANQVTSTSDFSEVVHSNFYVDKTLLIKDFIQPGPKVKVITAPTRFGKSTVINMLKRFFAIAVDSDGTKISPKVTDNYRLFCRTPKELEICKNETFTREHLRQYPVIHINYQPLKTIQNFETLLAQIRSVIRVTFEQHQYLSQNSSLFPTDATKNLFTNHYDNTGSKKLTKGDILDAFTWLSELLFKHFGRKVVVLLDEYDAYCNSLLFGKVDDVGDIINFLGGISESLFKYNDYLKKALLTGVLRVKGLGRSLTGNNMQDYRWSGDHEFSKYYGFTPEEVLKLINKNVKNETERNDIIEVLDSYYDGYKIQNQHTKVYSIWSVIKIFQANMKPESYWGKASYTKGVVRFIIEHKEINNEIKELILTGGYVYADISQPLDAEDIVNLKQTSGKTEDIDMERVILLFFDLGYLTTVGGNSDDTDLTPLEIPNNEIHMEFSKILRRMYVLKYHFKLSYIRTIHEAIESFKPNQSNAKCYKSFFQAAHHIIYNSEYYHMTENDFQSFLFVTIGSKFGIGKRITTEMSTSFVLNDTINNLPMTLEKRAKDIFEKAMEKTKRINATSQTKQQNKVRGRMEIIVGNTHKMAIIIETKVQREKRKNIEKELDKLAKDALIQILLTYPPYLNENPVTKFLKSSMYSKGKIYIGLAYDMQSRNISMASYCPSFDNEPSFISIHGDVNNGK